MDPIIFLFIAIVIGFSGFLLGFTVRHFTSRGSKSAKTAEPKKPAISKKSPKKNWVEVANLWRDSQDKNLIFQIENQYYKHGSELTDRERNILLNVVMDFYRWLEPPGAARKKPEVSDQPPATVQSRPDGLPTPENPAPQQQKPTQEIPGLTTPENKAPMGAVGGVLSATITPPESPTPSMVAQVDSILQEKLQEAKMQKWAVRLAESPNKGMVVWVGMEKYESLEDVPYERVRRIIRVSVAEWEARALDINSD